MNHGSTRGERSNNRVARSSHHEPVERVRGMLDQLPEAAARIQQITANLAVTFERSGFRPVHVPVVEFSELFLRKSGADVVSKMYAFTDHGGRRIALRPELTAPVARLYVNNAHQFTLPARLWYSGPAFRYEKPQRGRYRQFTQMGVELLGAPPGLADAELIALACAGLDRLGITDYRIVIGHLGVVLGMLAAFDLETRMRAAVLQALEGLKKSPESAISTRRWLEGLVGLDTDRPAAEGPEEFNEEVHALLATMDRPQAVKLVRSLLGTLRTELGGGRDPDEIVDRLLQRLSRTGDAARLDRAVRFVTDLAALAGPKEQALPATEALLRQYGVPLQPLEEFQQVCEELDAFGMDWSRVTVDLSLGRGLQYYTGPVFEIYCSSLGAESQLCGGGRYDGLVRDLGGRDDVPALGFSYGLERLALVTVDTPRTAAANNTALVVALHPSARAQAVRAAETLRDVGIRAELDVLGHGRRQALEHARRTGRSMCALIGEPEIAAKHARLRWLGTGEEVTVPLERLAEHALKGSA